MYRNERLDHGDVGHRRRSDVTGCRLWLDAAGNVVEDGDPSAATLLCGEADEIPDGYSAPKQARKVEDKAIAEPEADKSVKRTTRKS